MKKLLGFVFAAFLLLSFTAQAREVIVYNQTSQPTTSVNGDIWIDPSNRGVIYIQMSSGVWRKVGYLSIPVATVATADAGSIAAANSSSVATAAATDGTKSQGTLTMDTKPSDSVASQGTLSVALNPVGSEQSTGTLTIADQPREGEARVVLTLDTIPTDGDTMTVAGRVYTFQTTLTNVDGNIHRGATPNLAESKANLVAAFDLSGVAGTDYATDMTAHASVNMQAFISDDVILQAKTPGTAGNSLTSTEAFTPAGNIFDNATFQGGAAAADTMVIGATTYTFQNTLTEADCNVHIGALEATAKTNIGLAVAASGGTPGTDYASACTTNATVTIAAFSGDDAIISAITPGTAGDSIVTTETFSDAANVFDAATLGTTNAGVAGDTFTIDSHVYTFDVVLVEADCHILRGGSAGASQTNITNAIAASGGTPGTDYASACVAHSTVTSAAFAANDSVVTAVTAGTAGDALGTTETMGGAGNQFDAATLGTTTAGVEADTMTVDSQVYTFKTTIGANDCDVLIGANLAASKVNIVASFDDSGTAGTDYATECTNHATVTIAAFISDDAILTAVTSGTAGDAIVTTETFAAGTNIYDAATLGTTTAGVEAAYSTATKALVNEIRSDINVLVTLANELKTDYNTAITLINENKAQLNKILVELRNAGVVAP